MCEMCICVQRSDSRLVENIDLVMASEQKYPHNQIWAKNAFPNAISMESWREQIFLVRLWPESLTALLASQRSVSGLVIALHQCTINTIPSNVGIKFRKSCHCYRIESQFH